MLRLGVVMTREKVSVALTCWSLLYMPRIQPTEGVLPGICRQGGGKVWAGVGGCGVWEVGERAVASVREKRGKGWG